MSQISYIRVFNANTGITHTTVLIDPTNKPVIVSLFTKLKTNKKRKHLAQLKKVAVQDAIAANCTPKFLVNIRTKARIDRAAFYAAKHK